MFYASRWAAAFLASTEKPGSGTTAEETLACLKAFVQPLKQVQGIFLGGDAPVKLEAALRECAGKLEQAAAMQAVAIEYAIRFICLLAEKHSFKYIDSVIFKIDSIINTRNGVLDFTVESAVPLENDFLRELSLEIKNKTGAKDVNLGICINPQILGGYILRAKGYYIDASLKGQADKMMKGIVGGHNGKL